MWYFKYSYDTSAAKARVGVISIMLDNIPAWYETMPQSDYDDDMRGRVALWAGLEIVK